MPQNLMTVKSAEEMQKDVNITYAPLFLALKNKEYQATEIEEKKLTKITGSDADIAAKLINAQDTERAQVKAGKSSKTFNKQIFLVEYVESLFGSESALPELNDRVIKNLSKQLDRQVWTGTHNNGLFISSDANYVNDNSAALPLTISGSNGIDAVAELFAAQQANIESSTASGDVLALVYGASLKKYLRKLFQSSGSAYFDVIQKNFPLFNIIEVPQNLEADTNKGILFVSQEQVKAYHQDLPKVYDSGVEKRARQAWVQYIFGTAFIDLLEPGAIRKQPITIADA